MPSRENLPTTIYDFTVEKGSGEILKLDSLKGKVLLIVNTASRCGLTPQYADLQKLYEKYSPQGLEILAFPCNQFAKQEPGNQEEIQNFCSLHYAITFPILKKINVNGRNAHPLYRYLKERAPGLLGSSSIKWNFTKFLIDRQAKKIQRFSPSTPPLKLSSSLEKLLLQKAQET